MDPLFLGRLKRIRKKINLKFVQENFIGLPYPNYGIDLNSRSERLILRCYKTSDNVFYTDHDKDVLILYKNGAFGTSSLTFRCPSYLNKHYDKQPYFLKKQNAKRLKIVSDSSNLDSSSEISDSEDLNNEHNSEVKLSNGKLNQQEESNEKNLPKTQVKKSDWKYEKLILLPEEVIFLSFAVGCLSIYEENSCTKLTYQEVWEILCAINSDFPIQYAVYHYFRAKNWVPKSGSNFGGDFILYELSPDVCHSAYVVHIIGLSSRPRLLWSEILSLQRLASSNGKILLLVNASVPKINSFSNSTTFTPHSIFDIRLTETIIDRSTHFSSNDDTDYGPSSEPKKVANSGSIITPISERIDLI